MKDIPWSLEEVRLLNLYQSSGLYHPYTCRCGKDLKATREGWWCDSCTSIVQTWYSVIVPDIERQVRTDKICKDWDGVLRRLADS